ncbi:uncharacterized protein [Dendropsophus ebraccatus]|uniref:uncharacterized protein n=1 Tax=Dendropsophus ebraccatus TaxID=150705 RepID=UPI003831D573
MYHLLLIAALCCFAPGMSSVIRNGNVEQSSDEGVSCLQKGMENNEKAAESVAKIICMYLNSKGLPDERLIKAIQNLEEDTGCTTEKIFGTQNPEQVAKDENGVLAGQITIMERLLEKYNPFYHNVAAMCALQVINKNKEGTGLGNKRVTRGLLGGDLLGSLLSPVKGLLGGGLLDGLLGGQGLLGGLTGGLLGSQESGGQKGLLGNALGGVGGILGGQTNGGCGQASQGLGGLTGGVTDLLAGLLSGKGGLLGGVLNLPGPLLGSLLNGQGGPLGGLTNILGR